MSDYGKVIKEFKFDAYNPWKDAYLLNGSFVIHEKGLLLKTPEHIFTKWRDFAGIMHREDETTSITIDLKNSDGKIEAQGQKKEIDLFYDILIMQQEKYRYHDELKSLKVDLEEINIAMDNRASEDEVYFDTNTGEIIYIPFELNEDNVFDDAHVARLPQWEREMVEEVRGVYEDEEERYAVIPKRDSGGAYCTMVQFAKRLDDVDVSNALFEAINGRGAFRRFKDVLKEYPQIQEQWFEFKEDVEKNEVKEWLWSIGIEPF